MTRLFERIGHTAAVGSMPKAFGGRFLSKIDRDRLKGFEGNVSVTNADAAWIEAVVIQAHQAVEAWHNRGKAAA